MRNELLLGENSELLRGGGRGDEVVLEEVLPELGFGPTVEMSRTRGGKR
jgi:hypothetical protein